MWPALGREKERLQPVGPPSWIPCGCYVEETGINAPAGCRFSRRNLFTRLLFFFLQNHKTENQTFFFYFPVRSNFYAVTEAWDSITRTNEQKITTERNELKRKKLRILFVGITTARTLRRFHFHSGVDVRANRPGCCLHNGCGRVYT